MPEKVFVDTSAFFALMVECDAAHAQLVAAMNDFRSAKTRWITSDYILDETATLLNARGYHSLAVETLELVGKSRALQIEWMDPQRFAQTRILFSKYHDQGFSFTDCFSFALMREIKIRKALTKDSHFDVMGFEQILKG
jgi:predicted nucleic acid-binding protein